MCIYSNNWCFCSVVLVKFFFALRAAGVPVSLTELLTLLQGLRAQVVFASVEDFYHFARLVMVKDERYYDRFDRAFAEHFQGVEQVFAALVQELPIDWLHALSERLFSEEDKQQVQALGGWEKLLETLRERLKEQQQRHEGGSKWIGTRGTSPFGHGGYNPEGIRIGGPDQHRRAVKMWERREFRDFDDDVELNTREWKLALRKLRRFARAGHPDLLDLDGTISATARNAGLLDLKMMPERRNAMKVLLFLDVGGSMDDHVRRCEELFSAARSEFKHLEHFYFHNFIYERLWKDNRRRHNAWTSTEQVLRTYGADYRVIIVGDASMSPYEILQPGGSVEHFNEQSGAAWMQRIVRAWPYLAWINPEPVERWAYTQSIHVTRELIGDRMFPLTLRGLDEAIGELKRRGKRQSQPCIEENSVRPT